MSNEMSVQGARKQFDSLVPWARCLYKDGRSSADVMCAIYGIDLPSEAYIFHRAYSQGLELDLKTVVHPWVLIALAADPSVEVYTGDIWARRQEERASAEDPRYLPLLQLGEDGAIHGNCLIGYNIDSLAAGQTTIFGIEGDYPVGRADLRVLGPSLLTVLHEWQSDCLRMMRYQYSLPSNFGAGSVDEDDVERLAEELRAIEALQKIVSRSTHGEPADSQ